MRRGGWLLAEDGNGQENDGKGGGQDRHVAEGVQTSGGLDVRQRFAALGLQTAGGSPEQFGNLLKNELRKWAKVVADSGISVD